MKRKMIALLMAAATAAPSPASSSWNPMLSCWRGLAVHQSNVADSRQDVLDWLDKLGY